MHIPSIMVVTVDVKNFLSFDTQNTVLTVSKSFLEKVW